MSARRRVLFEPGPIRLRPSVVVHANDGTDGSTFTFSNFRQGGSMVGRLIVGVAGWQSAGTGDILDAATPPTIGGVTATIHANLADGNFASLGLAIFSAVVPDGMQATTVLTMTGSVARAALVTIPLFRASTTLYDTPATYDGVGGSPGSLNQALARGGIIIAGATNGDGSPGYSWSGHTQVLADANMEAANARYTAAVYAGADEEASHNIQVAYSAGQGPMAAISVAPS